MAEYEGREGIDGGVLVNEVPGKGTCVHLSCLAEGVEDGIPDPRSL